MKCPSRKTFGQGKNLRATKPTPNVPWFQKIGQFGLKFQKLGNFWKFSLPTESLVYTLVPKAG